IVFWASSAAANRKPSSPKKAKKAMKIKNKNKTAITTVTIVLTIVVHFAYRHIKNRPTGKKKIKNNTITQVCSYHFSIDSASPIEFLLISFIYASDCLFILYHFMFVFFLVFFFILLHTFYFSFYLLFMHLIAYLPYIILCLYFFVHLFLIEHKFLSISFKQCIF